MGLIVRMSSCHISPPLPPQRVSSAFPLHGKLVYPGLRTRKVVTSVRGALISLWFPLRNVLPVENQLREKYDDVCVPMRQKGVLNHFGSILKHDHQEIAPFRSPAAALLVSSALMFAAPMEALAETCEADNSLFNMPLLLLIALVGATVGGLLARQRKGELQRVNEQLRQINAALRRQAKIESYAPSLSYAPVGARIEESELIVDPKKQELISHLKAGKTFLRSQNPDKAYMEFKAALELAQSLKDPIEEKKAARGLGASLQRQGKYKEAITYHSMVLAICKREGEDSGSTEAYGAIADCYTELGDLERAGKFYDHYIARLEKD